MTGETGLRRALSLAGSMAILMSAIGCVSAPGRWSEPEQPLPQTRVFFYPTRGQSAEQQDRDKYECNSWAVQQSGFDPSAPNVPPHLHVVVSPGPPPGSGTATGAIAGALIGATVFPPWEAGRGAIFGALAGAAIGGAAESAAAQSRQQEVMSASQERAAQLEEQARNFRRAMTACLVGRGYEVR